MISLKGRLGLALIGLVVAAGCGGGGSSSSNNDRAALRLTMDWPAVTRMVPNAANSVVTVVKVKGKEIARGLFVRPTDGSAAGNQLLLQRLPAGEATVTMTAYPTNDGTGVPQAEGSATKTLVKGQTVEENATMASTVERLSISPAALLLTHMSLHSLTVEARDAQNRVVLLKTDDRENLTWTSSQPLMVPVSADGVVTASTIIPATISVSMAVNDGGQRVSASVPVSVMPFGYTLTSLDIAPANSAGGQFTATGHFSNGQSVDVTSMVAWSASAPGSITAGGLFAMSGNGTSTVTATLNAFSPTRTITLPVAAHTLTSIAITPSGHTDMDYQGETKQFTAIGTYSDNTTENITGQVTWTSSDPTVGACDAAGLFTVATNYDHTTSVTATKDGVTSNVATVTYVD